MIAKSIGSLLKRTVAEDASRGGENGATAPDDFAHHFHGCGFQGFVPASQAETTGVTALLRLDQ